MTNLNIRATSRIKKAAWYGSSYHSAIVITENGKQKTMIDKSASFCDNGTALKFAEIWRQKCLQHGKVLSAVQVWG